MLDNQDELKEDVLAPDNVIWDISAVGSDVNHDMGLQDSPPSDTTDVRYNLGGAFLIIEENCFSYSLKQPVYDEEMFPTALWRPFTVVNHLGKKDRLVKEQA